MRPSKAIRNRLDTTGRAPTGFIEEPLVLRLLSDYGKLPSGFCYSLPLHATWLILRRRIGVAVGTLGALPDLTLTEDEWEAATA